MLSEYQDAPSTKRLLVTRQLLTSCRIINTPKTLLRDRGLIPVLVNCQRSAFVFALLIAAAPAVALPDVGTWVSEPPPGNTCATALKGVAAPSPGVGVAVGDCVTVLLTEDDGATWTPVSDHTYVGDLRGVDARGDTIVAVGRHEAFNWALSYTSLDRGDTWTYKAFCVSSAVPIDDGGLDSCSDGWLFDVAILPDGSFHAVGGIWNGKGYLAVSRTSGTGWMTYPQVEAPLHGIDFADDGLHGIAVGAQGLSYRTTDGGHTWTRGGDVPGLGDAMDVSVASADEAWAVGEQGAIARSIDHGATWLPIVVSSPVDFHAVHFTAPGEGRIAGDDGVILRLVNGAVWVPEPSSTQRAVVDIAFAGNGSGFGVTSHDLLTYVPLELPPG